MYILRIGLILRIVFFIDEVGVFKFKVVKWWIKSFVFFVFLDLFLLLIIIYWFFFFCNMWWKVILVIVKIWGGRDFKFWLL